ncbi:MAG: SGNH/GDSL hydrolase family protein [Prevotella sp.]|nr:SGNH/GDSL hydrolase family protein [Prevotella sp.]MEE0337300.1 SGNH/GDSL hydrolase family protein [Prevotella sp.]
MALTALLAWGSMGIASAQRHDFAQFDRYAKANAELPAPAKGEKRVVFMGNSITDIWAAKHPDFFKQHGYVGRGISGQTSYQFLLRFRQDVIDLKPKLVVINYGTNDIAENTGAYDEDKTFNNVCSMVDMARANHIKVILCSTLPAENFSWRPNITDGMQKIRHLNERVKAYCKANKIPYVDYFSAMLSEDGMGMKKEYQNDTVHPNVKGYDVMEAIIVPAIEKALK